MKKIAAIVVFAFIALTAFANKYTDKLTVTVNGESMEQQTTIDVTKGDDGKYTLSLNNFCLESPNEDGTLVRLGVGNIILPDREGTTVDGVTTITYNDALLITEGNDAGIEGWMGPLLGPVPIEMVARFNDTQLYCEIHINLMDLLGQLIDVVFGSEPEAIAEVL
ncbi:MAG: calycin-like domain-containing protein, partial [Prevotella sp.]|nr:calycin-like domain-containing protein [Prevotella sp.]